MYLKVHIRVGSDEESAVLESPLQLDSDHFAREFLQERTWVYGCDLHHGVSLDVQRIFGTVFVRATWWSGPKIQHCLTKKWGW